MALVTNLGGGGYVNTGQGTQATTQALQQQQGLSANQLNQRRAEMQTYLQMLPQLGQQMGYAPNELNQFLATQESGIKNALAILGVGDVEGTFQGMVQSGTEGQQISQSMRTFRDEKLRELNAEADRRGLVGTEREQFILLGAPGEVSQSTAPIMKGQAVAPPVQAGQVNQGSQGNQVIQQGTVDTTRLNEVPYSSISSSFLSGDREYTAENLDLVKTIAQDVIDQNVDPAATAFAQNLMSRMSTSRGDYTEDLNHLMSIHQGQTNKDFNYRSERPDYYVNELIGQNIPFGMNAENQGAIFSLSPDIPADRAEAISRPIEDWERTARTSQADIDYFNENLRDNPDAQKNWMSTINNVAKTRALTGRESFITRLLLSGQGTPVAQGPNQVRGLEERLLPPSPTGDPAQQAITTSVPSHPQQPVQAQAPVQAQRAPVIKGQETGFAPAVSQLSRALPEYRQQEQATPGTIAADESLANQRYQDAMIGAMQQKGDNELASIYSEMQKAFIERDTTLMTSAIDNYYDAQSRSLETALENANRTQKQQIISTYVQQIMNDLPRFGINVSGVTTDDVFNTDSMSGFGRWIRGLRDVTGGTISSIATGGSGLGYGQGMQQNNTSQADLFAGATSLLNQ